MANFRKFRNWNLVFSVTLIVTLEILPAAAHQLVSMSRAGLDIGQPGTFEFFNSIHGIIINEESLNDEKFTTGNCDRFDTRHRNRTFLKYPNDCDGSLRYCWLHEETKKRSDAYMNYYLTSISMSNRYNRVLQPNRARIFNTLTHSGNTCGCLCERSYKDKSSLRGEILDSFCLDPVVVNRGFVATGVRFKRHHNRIHLELQEGLLANGTIDPSTVKWKVESSCVNSQKVFYNFKNDKYEGLKIILEDMTLSENSVVTGVVLGVAIFGRRVDEHGNINPEDLVRIQPSQCNDEERTVDLVHGYSDLLPPSPEELSNPERGSSCNHHVEFGGTSFRSDRHQHTVPFIDTRKVETTPPMPISGIGWFYKGFPGYGGYFSLRVFF